MPAQKVPLTILTPLLLLLPIPFIAFVVYPKLLAAPQFSVSRTSQVLHVDAAVPQPPSPQLYNVWRTSRETCPQWLSAQQSVNSYLDCYVIGTQKGGTSELSKRLHQLGARRNSKYMKKEWHFFNLLSSNGIHETKPKGHTPFTFDNIPQLRIMHYISGHPDAGIESDKDVPIIDSSPVDERAITVDMTVEYMHSDRSAFLSHLVTPHAKIVAMIREPIERAVSQYNMILRIANDKMNRTGDDKLVPTKEDFHTRMENEIKALRLCGFDDKTATYNGTRTSDLQGCVIKNRDSRFFVLRGLYSLHMEAWRHYFPDHRIQYVLFDDTLKDPATMLKSITDFLCIRPFPQTLLDEYSSKSSNVSFGQATALFGAKGVQDNYGGLNGPTYMTEILPETRSMLRDFFRASDQKLEWMLGRKPYDYQ